MPRTSTLQEMREAALSLADQSGSDFTSTTILNRYVNDAIAELYDELSFSDGIRYYLQSTTISGAPPGLPADFYQLISARIGTDPLVELQSNERVEVTPLSGSYAVTLEYIPHATVLANDSDVFDGINGWEDFVVNTVAARLVRKEDGPVEVVSSLKADARAAMERVMRHANRVKTAPKRVQDVGSRSSWRFPYGTRRSGSAQMYYRIEGDILRVYR